jgi:integrase
MHPKSRNTSGINKLVEPRRYQTWGSTVRVIMGGLLRHPSGIYYARKAVPERLQEAVAQVLDNGKERQAFLKKSLGTRDSRQAAVVAKLVLADFDRTLLAAEDLIKQRPARATLTHTEISRMAEYYHAALLRADDVERSSSSEKWAEDQDEVLERFRLGEMTPMQVSTGEALDRAREALAASDLTYVRAEVAEVSAAFNVRLDENSVPYRALSLRLLQEHVRALEALSQRDRGVPVLTPTSPTVVSRSIAESGSLADAFKGWVKARKPAPSTVREYERALSLHGNLPANEVKRSHARAFREALQAVTRRGPKGNLNDMVAYATKHPEAPRIMNATINKNLGGIQAVLIWARDEGGIIPDDEHWSDPFEKMRLEEEESDREPFDSTDLQRIFSTPVFTQAERPDGGKGDAAFWMPLLALFTGARRGELAGLSAANVVELEGVLMLRFVRDIEAGKRLKTKSSRRDVPVHSRLLDMGFARFVERQREKSIQSWLFPELSPAVPRGIKNWGRWFGRYVRSNADVSGGGEKVFHSFRHTFKDGARRAGLTEEIHDAITGHSNGQSVGRSYGARTNVQRFGAQPLKEAIDRISFDAAALAKLRWDQPHG